MATHASRSALHALRRHSTAHDGYARLRLIILGPPGGGKGTISAYIMERWRTSMIGMGDLLRKNVDDKTDVGRVAEDIINQGDLLPDDVVMDLAAPELDKLAQKDWILDGLPRTRSQAVRLDHFLEARQRPLNLVLSLSVPDDVILRRIEGRWIHPGSGRVYNTTYNPPRVAEKDDVTGEPLVKRKDDNAVTFSRRLAAFHEETEGILDFYSRKRNRDGSDKLISVTGRTSSEIWPQVINTISTRFPHLQ